jgi:hypothetical protein
MPGDATSQEVNVKKPKKLAIKKVTLQNLDEPTLNQVAGGDKPTKPNLPGPTKISACCYTGYPCNPY